jgi:hypothetical protein
MVDIEVFADRRFLQQPIRFHEAVGFAAIVIVTCLRCFCVILPLSRLATDKGPMIEGHLVSFKVGVIHRLEP